MPRQLEDWLESFLSFTEGTEAPRRMHFWVGASTLAGALRRKVWVDMTWFTWYANLYIVLVADPGIISKTTTMNMGHNLLKNVPGINFGPDVVTWQAIPGLLTEACETFEFDGENIPMSALTFASGELGNLIDPRNRDMVNFYIRMYDNEPDFGKKTKNSGNDAVKFPWINLIGCTTPHWISDNMPPATVGGGFTSRCVFIFGDKKERLIAWPDEHIRKNHAQLRYKLINDLEYVSNLAGPMTISKEARRWGEAWYEKLWTDGIASIHDSRMKGYISRKQSHMVKLAMLLSVSRGDSLTIELEDMAIANKMLSDLEPDLDKIFSSIGKTEQANHADELVSFVQRYGTVPYAVALNHVRSYFPDFREFEGVLVGCIRAGVITMDSSNDPKNPSLIYTGTDG